MSDTPANTDTAADRHARRKSRRQWREPVLLLLPVFLLMAYTFVGPLLNFLRFSFYQFKGGVLVEAFSFETYVKIVSDPFFHIVIYDTLKMASLVTILSLMIGYPLAYALWRINRPGLQKWLGLLIFSPILVSVVVRSYGWTVLLSDQGLVNYLLLRTGLTDTPLELVFNLTGVLISMTHIFLPFVVFPIFSSMTRLDPAVKEAAFDLGAGWWTTFRRVTLPLTLPGLVAGAQICFTLAIGAFVTPAMLGGGRVLVLPLEVYRATSDINWPLAAVGGLLLMAIAFVAVAAFNRLLRFCEFE